MGPSPAPEGKKLIRASHVIGDEADRLDTAGDTGGLGIDAASGGGVGATLAALAAGPGMLVADTDGAAGRTGALTATATGASTGFVASCVCPNAAISVNVA